MNELVEGLVRRFNKLESERAEKIPLWQEVCEYLMPERANFFGGKTSYQQERLKIFDSTPEDAAQLLAAALQTFLTSPVHKWFSLGLGGDDELSDDAKDWVEAVENRMMAKFNSEESGFQSAVHELWMELPILGTAGFYVEEGDEIRFSSHPLNQLTVSENSHGVIDTIFRKFEMTARQMAEQKKWNLSDSVKEALEKDVDKRFQVIHVIAPRAKSKEGSLNPKHMPIASYYIELESAHLLSESGFHEMPMMIPRWSKNSGESYGRGIGQRALPDVRVLNEMNKTALIAGEKQADPTMFLPHDGFLGEVTTDGGAINYYRGTGDIKDKILTIGADADLNAVLAMIQQKQDSIKRMFLNDKLQQVGGPQMTATEVIATQEEKMRILGPVLGRLQSEFLAPLIKRVFGIMLRNNEFPEVPQELAGQEVKIQYISPISRAQKQTEAQSFSQAMGYLMPLVEITQGAVLQNFDMDAIARDSQKLFGYPPKYLKSLEQIEKEKQAQQAEAQKQQQMQEASQALMLKGAAKEVNGEAL